MSGHSKWANIKHKKAKMDEKKGKIFTKIGREIIVAVKHGGSDPNTNLLLKNIIQKAKENNMPNDNIQRVIQKASGNLDGQNYEELVYEGYGPAGTAILLDIMTDNRNRTAGEIRHIFSKNGGSLGETGCVAWMFEAKGLFVVDITQFAKDEDELMLLAIEAGAEDVTVEGEEMLIYTAKVDFDMVKDNMLSFGITFSSAEITKIPKNSVVISDLEQAQKIIKLIDLLEDNDDVQAVYSNFEIDDSIADQI
ncbi:YebC/PmpR family DNA-binding transcriptional regulator [Bacillota bacterium LX-D]|nr:YebC/PmpR family DNA-binding transcriptional regulator [Bacillota bacterium LX-D]